MAIRLPQEADYDTEEQFILRITNREIAKKLSQEIDSGVELDSKLSIEWKPDMRNATVIYDGQVLNGRLVDLPCVIESMKTLDKKMSYKTADICQMLVCSDEPIVGPIRGTMAHIDKQVGSKKHSLDFNHESREYKYLHGITPPMKNVLRKRFRKTRKRSVDMLAVEKEVRRMLFADLQADSVKWEVIWSPPTNSNTGQAVDASSGLAPSTSNAQQGLISTNQRAASSGKSGAIVNEPLDRDDIFGEVSSSSNDSDDSTEAGSDTDIRQLDVKVSQANSASVPSSHSTKPSSSSKPTSADQLAAELLLSDSGEDSPSLNEHHAHSVDEDGFQASSDAAAAQLLEASEAHQDDCQGVDIQTTNGINVAGLGPIGVELDVDDEDDIDEDDNDAFMHGGGELLDDEDDDDEQLGSDEQ